VTWIAMYAGAALISAAQLGAAMAASAESGRSAEKITWKFATSFPIPLTNAVNLLVPNFWGNNRTVPYYSERFNWEAITYYAALVCAGAAVYWGHGFARTAELCFDGDWGRILAWTAAKSDPNLDPETRVDLRQFTVAAFLPPNLQGKLGPAKRHFADVSARESAEFVTAQLDRAAIILAGCGLLMIGTMFNRRVSLLV